MFSPMCFAFFFFIFWPEHSTPEPCPKLTMEEASKWCHPPPPVHPVPDTIWGHFLSRNVAVIPGDLLPPSHRSICSILITLEFKARPQHCHQMLPV